MIFGVEKHLTMLCLKKKMIEAKVVDLCVTLMGVTYSVI